jgi:hypothetical protein
MGDLRVSVLREGLPPAVVGDALHRLEKELWYLHVEGGLYEFRTQPNLNRVVVDREGALQDQDIDEEVQQALQELAGREMQVILFPHQPADVPDNPSLKLAILDREYPYSNPATDKFVGELLKNAGTSFRTYRNTVLVLAADSGALVTLRQQARRLAALKSIAADRQLYQRLSESDRERLESWWRDTEGGVEGAAHGAYRYLAKLDETGSIKWWDMGISVAKESLSQRVRSFLQAEGLLATDLKPEILKQALGAEQHKTLKEVYETFARYPNFAIVPDREVVRRAAAAWASNGGLPPTWPGWSTTSAWQATRSSAASGIRRCAGGLPRCLRRG